MKGGPAWGRDAAAFSVSGSFPSLCRVIHGTSIAESIAEFVGEFSWRLFCFRYAGKTNGSKIAVRRPIENSRYGFNLRYHIYIYIYTDLFIYLILYIYILL